MKVIRPNCRIQFTAQDIDFIISVLGKRTGDADCLTRLLADEESRNLILDDPALLHALLEHRGCLRVSHHLYFYVLVRHVLKRAGVDDRAVADHVAEMLSEFSQVERTACRVPGRPGTINYFFEMLAALESVDDRTAFQIRAHIGNQSLFLAGVFPERIRYRAEHKGFPDLSYYEALGQSSYRAASDHKLAARYELASIYATLSDRFQAARHALNEMSDRLISLGDSNSEMDQLLRCVWHN